MSQEQESRRPDPDLAEALRDLQATLENGFRGLREELVRIEEAIRDTAPRSQGARG